MIQSQTFRKNLQEILLVITSNPQEILPVITGFGLMYSNTSLIWYDFTKISDNYL